MYGYIYLTENLINHKKYIGKKSSKKFLGTKYLGSGKILTQAVNKYGKENFTVTMLDTAENLEELNQKEIYYISKYNAQENTNFYNISKGGLDGGPLFKGHKHTDETKQKISNKVKGTKNGFYGKHHSEECKKIMSEKRKQRITSDETRLKMSEARKGIKFTEDHKRKISEAQRGEKSNNWGKTLSSEVKQKISNTVHNQIWLNNGIHCIRVPKEDLEHYLNNGYVKGRLPFRKGSTTIESKSDNRNITEDK